MKKALIALAAVAACGVASAQSSVSIYGVADVSVGRTTESTTNNAAKGKRTTGLFSSSLVNNSNSFIGFKGTEDLGNGLKANFQFEQGINLNDGAADVDGAFSRQAWVGLSGNFGELRAGRTDNATDDAISAWELLGKPEYSIAGRNSNLGGADSAILKYSSPIFANGLKAVGSYVFKNNRSSNDKAKYDLALIYENEGPLAAAISYSRYEKDSSTKDYGATIGASYDFGSFKVASSYFNVRTGQNGSPNAQKIRGVSLGASVPLSDNLSLAVDAAHTKKKNIVPGNVNDRAKKGTDWVIEGKYSLSKRTFVYAVYVRGDQKLYENDLGKNNYGIGLQHSF